MITDKDIARINELYKKRKNGEASEEEIVEHEALRKKYIESVRANMKAQLDNIVIVNEDGTQVNLGEKHKQDKK